MFCPKCATQNIEGASFCRVCGANISLVPQALTGQLPRQTDYSLNRRTSRHMRHQPTVEQGVAQLVSGIGFLAVALCVAAFAPAGRIWWFWLLIPAFSMLGRGISVITRARENKKLDQMPPQISNPSSIEQLPPRQTGELPAPVPSVTEGTTRHLSGEAATRQFDSYGDQKPS